MPEPIVKQADGVSYTKTANGVQTSILNAVSYERSVLVHCYVDEVFANGNGAQTTFKIGETGNDDSITATSGFTNAVANDTLAFGGLLSADCDLFVTATAATGTGTGGLTIVAVECYNA